MKSARLIFLLLLIAGAKNYLFADCVSDSTVLCPGMELKRFFYDNGKVSSEGCWYNGQPEGEWKNYDQEGNLLSKGVRRNLLLEGVWSFYQKGNLTSEITYHNNRKNGVSRTFLPEKIIVNYYVNDTLQGNRIISDTSGRTLQITPFKDGVEHGLERKYSLQGDITLFTFYKNGITVWRQQVNHRDEKGLKQGVWKDFYLNGTLHWECAYKNGLRHGYYKTYDSLGNLISMEKYENDVLQEESPELAELSIHTEYYANGKPKFRVPLKDGKPEGLCRQYDSITGKVVRGIVFKNGEVVGREDNLDEYGNKTEEHVEYYADGKLKCQGRIYKGKKYGQWKYYYPSGRVEQEGEYKNGHHDGQWLWYYPNGKLRLEQEYYQGKLDGLSVEYDDSARIVAKGRYVEDLEEGRWEYTRGEEFTEGAYVGGEKDGIWRTWWNKGKNKKLAFEGRYVGGIPDGYHRYFRADGTLKEEGSYRLGKRIGTWIKYDKDGNPEVRVRYDAHTEEEVRYNGRRTLTREEEKVTDL